MNLSKRTHVRVRIIKNEISRAASNNQHEVMFARGTSVSLPRAKARQRNSLEA